jgi:hypothetical protein
MKAKMRLEPPREVSAADVQHAQPVETKPVATDHDAVRCDLMRQLPVDMRQLSFDKVDRFFIDIACAVSSTFDGPTRIDEMNHRVAVTSRLWAEIKAGNDPPALESWQKRFVAEMRIQEDSHSPNWKLDEILKQRALVLSWVIDAVVKRLLHAQRRPESVTPVQVPANADFVLHLVIRSAKDRERLLGDLHEQFHDVAEKFGPRRATVFYWWWTYGEVFRAVAKTFQKWHVGEAISSAIKALGKS